MDTISAFFNSGTTFKSIAVPTGHVNVETICTDDSSDTEEESSEVGTGYVEEYEKKEIEMYTETFRAQKNSMSCMESTFDLVSDDEETSEVKKLRDQTMINVYTQYQFTANSKTQSMPIDLYKDHILGFLNSTPTTIIHGPTGCGKTTQVPQFILDKCREAKEYCNIVVTQPRRIAAISVARRVCEERAWALGTVCGYQVGLEKVTSNDTILTYMTTGVLLQKLVHKKHLREFTHIIIDEVHERTQEMDFLLLIIRRYIYTNSPNVKVILMSATIDTDKFASYFRTHSIGHDLDAPTVFIGNESNYKTSIYYIGDLKTIGSVPFYDPNDPCLHHPLYDMVARLILIFDDLEVEAGEDHIGHVLVFLPGILEIEEAYSTLTAASVIAGRRQLDWLILPLHSTITSHEQKKVFLPPPPNTRKIILSTNIAESSITVVDIEYVIDFCLTKVMVVDPVTNYQSLKLEWASKVNCTQRSGRVGRCANGRVYRMVPNNFYKDCLLAEVTPEMHRAPLERIVLCTKMLELLEPPKAILALAIDPPELQNIEQTIFNLKEIGALLTTCHGEVMKSDGDLTFLGHLMASLPLDVKLSKMIALGYMFSCLQECVIMAAACSLSNIFTSPFQEKLKSYSNRVMWADGSNSDLMAYLNLYKVWERNCQTAFKDNKEKIEWCQQNYLAYRTMKEWDTLIEEIKQRLDRLGISDSVGPSHVSLSHAELPLVLKIVISGAFYPNYFKKSASCGQINEAEAVKMLNGLDPMQSVYFTNMDVQQPGPLYSQRIKEYLSACGGNMNVYFSSSSKIFVQFLDYNIPQTVTCGGNQYVASIPGKVSVNVYKAVRMRQNKIDPILNVMSAPESWKRAQTLGIATKTEGGLYILSNKKSLAKKSSLPSAYDITVNIRVTHVIDAAHFFAQPTTEEIDTNIAYIHDVLNSQPLDKPSGEIMVNNLYATRYKEDNQFYRCKVMALIPYQKNDTRAQIIFIDFGNTGSVLIDELFCIPTQRACSIPDLAMECVLSELQPSVLMNPKALWSNDANKFCEDLISGKILTAKVFSVVNGVVSVELFNDSSKVSLNQYLIKKGFAQPMEESFLSKNNHVKRLQVQSYTSAKIPEGDLEERNFNMVAVDVKPPPKVECRYLLKLKGPYSPLETNVFSCTDNSKVSIDLNSVNSVLLDTDPQNAHERLFVCVNVSQHSNTGVLSLRHTTLMPNIPGFPAIMSMLFCPTMAIKPIQTGTCFGAILCGLGVNPSTKKAVYPAHDMVLTLDTKIDTDDLIQINEIRYWLNQTLSTMEMIHKNTHPSVTIEMCQREIKDRIFSLLKRLRPVQEPCIIKNANSWTKYEYTGDFLLPGKTYIDTEIWPLHKSMSLIEGNQQVLVYKQNHEDLLKYARKIKALEPGIECKLCEISLHDLNEIRLHIASDSHRRKLDTRLH